MAAPPYGVRREAARRRERYAPRPQAQPPLVRCWAFALVSPLIPAPPPQILSGRAAPLIITRMAQDGIFTIPRFLPGTITADSPGLQALHHVPLGDLPLWREKGARPVACLHCSRRRLVGCMRSSTASPA